VTDTSNNGLNYVYSSPARPTRGRGYRSAIATEESREIIEAHQEAEEFRRQVIANSDFVSEELAISLSRAYQAAPHMSPQSLVSAVLGGADEQTIQELSQATADLMASGGFAPSDEMMDYWRSVSNGVVYSIATRGMSPGVSRGMVDIDGRQFSVGPMEKITEERAEYLRKRNSPEGFIGQVMTDLVNFFQRKEAPTPAFEVAAAAEQVNRQRELAAPLAMISARNVTDFLTSPLRVALDKTTPDFITDPASDILRGTTRYGFAAVQAATDLPENIIMAATADPDQAHLGFRARIAEEGVLPGLGAGFANAYLATGFGQATRQLFDDPSNVDTGSGFFMGGLAQQEADKLKPFTLGFYTDQEGNYLRTRSVGTAAAEFLSSIDVISQDDYRYNAVSGLLDMTYEIFVDPTNRLAFKGWGDEAIQGLRNLDSKTAKEVADFLEESRHFDDLAAKATDPDEIAKFQTFADAEARKALEAAGINTSSLDRPSVRARLSGTTDQEIAVRAFIAEEAGIIRENGRRTVLMPEFAKFLVRGRGRKLVQRLQDIDNSMEVKRLFRGNIGNGAAARLAEAKTPEEVLRVMVEGISNPSREFANTISMVPHVGLFSVPDKGLWVRRQIDAVTRFGKMLPPGTILNVNNGDEFVANLSQILDQIPNEIGALKIRRYDEAWKNQILDEYIRAFAKGDMGEIKQITTKLARKFTQIFAEMGYHPDTADALTRFVQNEDRLSAFRWSELANDGPINTNIVLLNDLLSSGIMIIDSNRFLDVVRQGGRMRTLQRQMSGVSKELKKLDELTNRHAQLLADGNFDEADQLVKEVQDLKRRIDAAPSGAMEFEKAFLARQVQITDRINDFWKTTSIMRAAYPLRVIPEEVGRVLLTGVFDSWADWFVTSVTTLERFRDGRLARYSGDALGRKFVRTTKKIENLRSQIADLSDELDNLRNTGRGDDPRVDGILKEIDELEARYMVEQEAWDASFRGYGQAQIGQDRQSASRTLTRKRAKDSSNTQSTSVANRFNRSQTSFWVQGVTERIIKFSLDEPSRLIARAHLGYGVKSKETFELNGRVATVKQHLEAGESIDDVFAAFYHHGPGRSDWERFAQSLTSGGTPTDPDSLDNAFEWVSDIIREIEYVAGAPKASRLFPAVKQMPFSMSDDKLMRAIATGRFDKRPLQYSELIGGRKRLGYRGTRYVKNSALEEHVRLWAFNDNAPDQVFYTTKQLGNESRETTLENVANFIFGELYGVPSDILARAPAWKRLYWKQMAEFVRTASPKAAATIVKNAEKANLPKPLMTKLRANAKLHLGDATAVELDDFANAAATKLTKDLLFDATRRGATADATRIIVAFGDAWYEVMKTWTRANLNRGGMPIKSLMKGIQGARDFSMFGSMAPTYAYVYDPETGEYEQVLSQKRQGFFYKDQTTDQWMYGLPMSDKILDLAYKVAPGDLQRPGGFAAPVEGLNIFGSLSPGVGPFGAIVTNALIPEEPGFDWLEDILYPFGAPIDPEEQAAADIGLSTFIPGWAKRAMIAVGETVPQSRGLINLVYNYQRDPAFMNLQVNIMKSLNATGNYSNDREGRAKLEEDTRKSAGYLSGLWAVAQFMGPASPTFRPLAQTRNPQTGEIEGNVSAYILIQELNDRRRAYLDAGERPDQAVEDLAMLYGPYVYLYATPNTQSRFPGQEQTQEWWDWYRTGDNKRFVEDFYPNVGAYFGAVNGERNNEVANEMRSAALTSPKTLDQLVEDGQRVLGYLRLDEWMRNNGIPEQESGRTRDQARAVALYKTELEQYLGISFENKDSMERRALQINELSEMVRLYDEGDEFHLQQLDNDFGDRVRIYIAARNAMREQSQGIGLSADGWLSARDGIGFRDQMRELGAALSEGSPGFARLYQYVLRGEMVDVDDEIRLEVGQFIATRPVGQ